MSGTLEQKARCEIDAGLAAQVVLYEGRKKERARPTRLKVGNTGNPTLDFCKTRASATKAAR
jgi:hypothetical protein